MRRSLVVLVFGAAVLLSACGGDSSKDSSTTPAQSSTTPGAPSTAKSSTNAKRDGKKSDRKHGRSRRGSKSKGKDGSGRSRRGRSRRGGSNDGGTVVRPKAIAPKPGSQPRTPQQAPPPTPKSNDKNSQLPQTDEQTYKSAKLVCGGLYETALRGKTKEEAARNYANAWPKDRQDAAYKGCRAGLDLPRPNPDDEADY